MDPFYRETRSCVKNFCEKFWKFFSGAIASLIRPEKTEVKLHNFAAKSLLLSPKAQVYGTKSYAGGRKRREDACALQKLPRNQNRALL